MALAGGWREVVQPFDLLGAQLDAVGGGVLLDEGNLLERFCYLGSTREESREHFRWHRVEREWVTRRFSVSTMSLKLMKSPTRGARKECVGRRDAARSPAERGIGRLSTFALCCRLRALVASQWQEKGNRSDRHFVRMVVTRRCGMRRRPDHAAEARKRHAKHDT
jgi:hypothetical protein